MRALSGLNASGRTISGTNRCAYAGARKR